MTTYCVFTISRDDLIALSRGIARAVPHNFLMHKDRPVKIGVSGTIRSGKKIVADYGRAEILGVAGDTKDLAFAKHKKVKSEDDLRDIFVAHGYDAAGLPEHDEFVCGLHKGDVVEVSFMNMSWRCGYSFSYYKNANSHVYNDHERVPALYDGYLAHRDYGGIAYIHNAAEMGIDFDVEVDVNDDVISQNQGDDLCFIPDLLWCFNQRAGWDKNWLRYVEVRIPNEILAQQSGLNDKLKAMGFMSKDDLPNEIFLSDDQVYDMSSLPNIPLLKR
ncbi:MAG: hypothetical protein CL561_03030 [Alphaproteobacteria bacterium]|nr:hypothetical protein [Alphaproteobacteria bacterium]|tara:strand:- start:674484 stop:675305 length:822 start_codon:yes stop_codon:yes gene_type:complete